MELAQEKLQNSHLVWLTSLFGLILTKWLDFGHVAWLYRCGMILAIRFYLAW